MNKNAVIIAALKIVYEICKQDKLPLCFDSLGKIEKEIVNGKNLLTDNVVIEISLGGRVSFSIPDTKLEVANTLLALVKRKVKETPVSLVIEKEVLRKEGISYTEAEICKEIMEILEKENPVFQKDIRKRLEVSYEAMNNAVEKLLEEKKFW